MCRFNYWGNPAGKAIVNEFINEFILFVIRENKVLYGCQNLENLFIYRLIDSHDAYFIYVHRSLLL